MPSVSSLSAGPAKTLTYAARAVPGRGASTFATHTFWTGRLDAHGPAHHHLALERALAVSHHKGTGLYIVASPQADTATLSAHFFIVDEAGHVRHGIPAPTSVDVTHWPPRSR